MNFDRNAFLALAAVLSSTTMACSSSSEASDDSADELNQEATACTNPRSDVGAYPSIESCYDLGETWGQCSAWMNHFQAGVAHKATDLVLSGKEAYDAGYEALRSTCPGSADAESRLNKFCAQIAQLQLQQPSGWQIRSGEGTATRESLMRECTAVVRGIRLESRALIRRCVEKDPSFGVYSCVEGLGFDDARAKCTDYDAVRDARSFGCSDDAVCQRLDRLFVAPAAQEIKACVAEYEIIKTEAGARPTAQELQSETALCAVGTVARSCVKDDARPACEAIVGELKSVDTALGTKGHINAGGSFTKRCNKTLSALSADGRGEVGRCMSGQASQVAAKRLSGDALAKEMRTSIDFDRCVRGLAAK